MKLRNAFLAAVIVALTFLPATAQTLYNNGPVNGTTDAWAFNNGAVVSDTFAISNASTVTGVDFYAWIFPGDIIENAEVAITSSEFGGTVYSDQVVTFTASACSANQLGFDVCLESSSGMAPANLAAGTYWLNLEYACCSDDPFYWDENSGPSQASENSVGTIPSEAFTILGTSSTTTSGTTPEPSGFMLLGTGVIGIAGAVRRKLF